MTSLDVIADELTGSGPANLELVNVVAGYDGVQVLRGVDLVVRRGSIVGLLGPNGAGKTTVLRAATGLTPTTSGTVRIHGVDVNGESASQRLRAGLCLIPEGRGVFPELTVRDNLRLQVPPWAKDRGVEPALEVFPKLRARYSQVAGTMSGGEQQMLALARAVLARPSVVLVDEISMGLAPKALDALFEALQQLAATGIGLLLVEQYVHRALAIVDRAVLLNRGEVVFNGAPDDLVADEVLRGYLGVDID